MRRAKNKAKAKISILRHCRFEELSLGEVPGVSTTSVSPVGSWFLVTTLNLPQPTPRCLKVYEKYLVNCQTLALLIRKQIRERMLSVTSKYVARN